MINYIRTIDDHDLAGSFLFRQSVQDEVDGFTEDYTVSSELLRGSNVEIRQSVGLDVVQDIHSRGLGISTGGEVLDCRLDGDGIMTMGFTLDIRDLELKFSITLMPQALENLHQEPSDAWK